MGKGRLEAFSDGVIAVIITIMVLEMKPPHGAELADLKELGPVFLSYVLSFTNVGIYWNNHHHLFHAVKKVNGGILWANLVLLFWLSLMPFATTWMGENHFSQWPVFIYALDLMLCAISYTILVIAITKFHGAESDIAQAIGSDTKGKISLASYAVAIALTFVSPWAAGVVLIAVAIIWFIPDRRMEKVLK